MAITISKRGWIVETTNTVNGMLEQGGVSGRRELVTYDSLAKLGITGKPHMDYNNSITNEGRVRYAIRNGECLTRVIRKGHTIY